MRFQLFFYFIGFLILIFTGQFAQDLKSDRAYQTNIYARCIEIQTALNEDLSRC